jgi:prohibitin 2
MKASIGILSALFIVGLVVGGVCCAKLETIKPGYVGVSVTKCQGKGTGVRPDPIPAGYYWRELVCEEVLEYPTFVQTLILTKAHTEGSTNDDSITINSSEGMPINVDVSMSFTLNGAKVPKLYTTYRNDLDHIKITFLRQTIREALQATFAKYTAEQLYSSHKEKARAEAQSYLQDRLGGDGFVLAQFTVNELRVPTQITQAINAKVAMIQEAQRSEQEVRKTQALAKQRVAEAQGKAEAAVAAAEGHAKAKRAIADAEAYYNATVAKSITSSLIQYEGLRRWNGTLPTYLGGNAPMPFVQVHK